MNIKLFSKKSRKPVLSSANGSWRERLGEDAYTGWVVILLASFLVALSLAGLAVRLFFLIDSGSITAPAEAVPADHAAFDPAALNALMADFDARSAAMTNLEKGYAGPPDPSQ